MNRQERNGQIMGWIRHKWGGLPNWNFKRCDEPRITNSLYSPVYAPTYVTGMESLIKDTAAKLSVFREDYHDCDCPPHEDCGCKVLRDIILSLEYHDFTAEDAKEMMKEVA
jgi:hypothetical protein